MNTFAWLLKREYWENRGGFQWAPLIAAGVVLLVFTIGAITAVHNLQFDGNMLVGGVRIGDIASSAAQQEREHIGSALNLILFFSCSPVAITLAIVTFFYLLGSLYDERRDRSILFWKSLPVSDFETVLSKVAAATVIAPLFALVAALALMLGLLILFSILVAVKGLNPFSVIWANASPLSVVGKVAMLVPINAVWALPSIGWLMLCSAFAKRVPFLWATLLPIALGTCVSIFDAVSNLRIPDDWFWQHIVSRLLFSVMPGSWMDFEVLQERMKGAKGPEALINALDLNTIFAPLAGTNIWLGAAAGVGMIAVAIWLRRWRDDS